MVNEEIKPRLLRIAREVPISAGRFSLDYRMFWAVLLFVIGIAVLVWTTSAGVWGAGLALDVLIIVIYTGLFGTPLSAIGFRYGSHAWRNFTGINRHVADRAHRGEELLRDWSGIKQPQPIKLIGKVDFRPHETPDGVLGVAYDHRYGSYSALMWGAGSSLLSTTDETRSVRLRAFAALLDSLAESSNTVYRFAWHEQTLIGEPQHPAETLELLRQTNDLKHVDPPNQAVLLKRAAEMGQTAVVHVTTMTITILARNVRRQAAALGKGEVGYHQVLEKQLEGFYALAMGKEYGYSSIGLKAARFATYNDLVLTNRLVLDPVFAQQYWQDMRRPDDRQQLIDPQLAWPGYADFKPADHCRLGDTYHMGFYVQEFARAGMPPDQLWNILKLPIPKTVTVVFHMVPPRRAQRFAEWSTSGAHGSNVDRAKANRRVTAFQSQAAEDALAHETEMATRQGQVGRVRCYIDLTGATLEEVQDHASALKHASADARFVVEPLNGCQQLGIEAAMPVGRGLSSLTESWQWLNR